MEDRIVAGLGYNIANVPAERLYALYTHTMTRISDGEKYQRLASAIRAELDRRTDELILKLKL